MKLEERINTLVGLGNYLRSNHESFKELKNKAFNDNNWFIAEFVDLSVKNIADQFLQREKLFALAEKYQISENNPSPKTVGIVMAGNIPLVGFHDLICVFITGHYSMIKPSSKDEALIKHCVEKFKETDSKTEKYFTISSMLKGCDAYIATGSNNTSRYFEKYFDKYPNIIRRNRTSVAVLMGDETKEELEKLADDVHQYFGLGCRNVTKLLVPKDYDFSPLLAAFDKYSYFINHHKYKNNYEYNLALHIINNRYYMTNGSTFLVEDPSPFSPLSQVHYEYYDDYNKAVEDLKKDDTIQAVVSKNELTFGEAQCPSLNTYADGVDTIQFLQSLN